MTSTARNNKLKIGDKLKTQTKAITRLRAKITNAHQFLVKTFY
jgi:hypothetical protein